MKYDPSMRVAVFLGPSLDPQAAGAILPANYYPPVRMGDVYRLMTCGVRLIVIIDGVFHNTAPVWQREILMALQNGIAVVGASSMGALRALELEPWGMIGHGTVFQWYRSGRIEGDDEVALIHADGEFGYLPLSEPLVNIRHTLGLAVEAGVLTSAQQDALAAEVKSLDHTRRNYPALFEGEACAALPPATLDLLRQFVGSRPVNLKREDARSALAWCAANLQGLHGAQTGPCPAGSARRVERPDEVLLRGVLTPSFDLVPLRDLLTRAAEADRPRADAIVRGAARRFLVLDWMRSLGIEPPGGTRERFSKGWFNRHGIEDAGAWLAANALIESELRQELADRASEAWLLAEGPAAFGLTVPFLEAWAEGRGIEPPRRASDRSLSERILDQGPPFFGFDQWSRDVAFARELQVTGQVARLAAGGDGASPIRSEETVDAGAGAL